MTKRIRKSFTDNLKSEDWMDSSTKSKAKEKVCIKFKPAENQNNWNNNIK